MRGIASIPKRLANAFVVLFGQHGDVSREARKSGQTRQSMYRDARGVVEQVQDPGPQAEVERLRQELAERRERAQQLAARLEQAIEPSDELAARFASMAQAEGVSLPGTQRLSSVVLGRRTPSVSSLGRKTAEVAEKSARLLAVLDAHVRPQVRQAAADEIFVTVQPSEGRCEKRENGKRGKGETRNRKASAVSSNRIGVGWLGSSETSPQRLRAGAHCVRPQPPQNQKLTEH